MERVIEEVSNLSDMQRVIFFCVLTDEPVSSGCCACDGLPCVDQGCVCAQVHGTHVERRSGMRDPCFSVQCGSFTQRFLQVWRHLWNLLL